MNKKIIFAITMSFLIAVAIWTFAIVLIIVGAIDVIAYISETKGISFFNFLKIYFISYTIFLVFNLKTLKDYMKDKEKEL